MIDRKTFKKAIAQPLERGGFIKRGPSWHFAGKDAQIVFNVEKSDWSEVYHVNAGIWLHALGQADFPAYYQCHLYYAAESLLPEHEELILTAADLEECSQELLARLCELLETKLVPLLKELTDETRLRELFAQGRLEDGMVLREAREHLDGPPRLLEDRTGV